MLQLDWQVMMMMMMMMMIMMMMMMMMMMMVSGSFSLSGLFFCHLYRGLHGSHQTQEPALSAQSHPFRPLIISFSLFLLVRTGCPGTHLMNRIWELLGVSLHLIHAATRVQELTAELLEEESDKTSNAIISCFQDTWRLPE